MGQVFKTNNETSSKTEASSLQNEHFVRDCLQAQDIPSEQTHQASLHSFTVGLSKEPPTRLPMPDPHAKWLPMKRTTPQICHTSKTQRTPIPMAGRHKALTSRIHLHSIISFGAISHESGTARFHPKKTAAVGCKHECTVTQTKLFPQTPKA